MSHHTNVLRSLRIAVLGAAIVALLAFNSLGPVFAQANVVAAAHASAIRTILVFPFDNSAGDSAASTAAQLADAVKLRINAVGIYQATTFSVHLPAVQRALEVDNTLSPDDVKMPITDPATAQRIARICGTDGYVLGTLEGVANDANGGVKLTVSAVLYSTQTGTSLKTVAVTGEAAPSYKSEDPDAVLDRGTQDAAGKVVSALSTGAVPERLAVVPNSGNGSTNHNRISSGTIILAALAISLAAVVISNAGATGSGHSNNNSSGSTTIGGGSGPGSPPPPPGGG